jgi:SAM-dependent MidA family methyltransferase
MTSAGRLILAQIEKSGAITFPDFLSIALYDSSSGYYASGRAKIGRRGDFLTNVSAGPLYGELLARAFLRIHERLENPSLFLIEQGAHDGRLAADILDALQHLAPDIPVKLAVVEPSHSLRELQQKTLSGNAAGVFWVNSLSELCDQNAIFYSNELVDALPFHLVERVDDTWLELCVDWKDDRFVFVPRVIKEPDLLSLVHQLPAGLPNGYRAELRPSVVGWLRQIAGTLAVGVVHICDYGFPAAQLYHPDRTKGTMLCYRFHQRDEDPLADPGEKDISAHVDFSHLATSAGALGFQLAGYHDQHHFLVGIGEEWLRSLDGTPPGRHDLRKIRAFQTLMHPENMGRQFKHLMLTRNFDWPEAFPGLLSPMESRARLRIQKPDCRE